MTQNQQEYIPSAILQQILQSYPDLQYKTRQTLKKYLSTTKISASLIRQTIIEQGSHKKTGILIIEGTLLITKKISSGRLIFSQLNYLQIANIQVFLYDRAYYSATVHSSVLRYIEIVEPILMVLFQYVRDGVVDKEKARNREIQAKLKEDAKNVEMRDKQRMLDRLTLPALKFFSRENKDVQSTNQLTRKLMNSPKQSPRNHPLKKSHSQSRRPQKPPTLKQLQLPKKSPKSPSHTESNEDRNQRIFKQQLKAIIKRKLVYERKQLGVLKAYRNNVYDDRKVIYEEDGIGGDGGGIDQYFRF